MTAAVMIPIRIVYSSIVTPLSSASNRPHGLTILLSIFVIPWVFEVASDLHRMAFGPGSSGQLGCQCRPLAGNPSPGVSNGTNNGCGDNADQDRVLEHGYSSLVAAQGLGEGLDARKHVTIPFVRGYAVAAGRVPDDREIGRA